MIHYFLTGFFLRFIYAVTDPIDFINSIFRADLIDALIQKWEKHEIPKELENE